MDKVRVYVRGGGGGQGAPRYGGHGGHGGNVIAEADGRTTLQSLSKSNPKKRFVGGTGGSSRKYALRGKNGKDEILLVPPGVVVRNDAGRVLGELNEEGERVLLSKGGEGGNPQNGYLGHQGDAYSVMLDLKLIADIGFVGFPNAGKSTLLSALSRTNPKIASYPFTTIQPQLGTMQYEDQRQITVADLPGLIEGAHINVGMGHSFLKHVERTRLLLVMVDLHGFRLGPNHPARCPEETVLLLNKELELYSTALLNKPAILVLNKIDVPIQDSSVEEVMDRMKHLPELAAEYSDDCRPSTFLQYEDIIAISAKRRENVDTLKQRLREVIDYIDDLEAQDKGTVEDAMERVKQIQMEHRGTRMV